MKFWFVQDEGELLWSASYKTGLVLNTRKDYKIAELGQVEQGGVNITGKIHTSLSWFKGDSILLKNTQLKMCMWECRLKKFQLVFSTFFWKFDLFKISTNWAEGH